MKRTWVFGLCIILLTMFVVGYNIKLQRNIILQEAHRSTSNLVNSIELDLVRLFSDLDQTLTKLGLYLTTLTKKGEIDPPSVRHFIDNQLLENSDITGLSVIDDNGQILYWDNNSEKLNVSQRQYFRVHQSGHFNGMFIGLPQQSLINQEQWILGTSKALYNTDQSLFLVLSAIIDTKHLYRQYQPMITSPGINLKITSPAGHIYTSIPGHDELVGKQLPDFSRTRAQTFENDEEISIRKEVDGYPLVVTVTQDKGAALRPWKNMALSLAAVGIFISLLVFFLTYRVVQHQREQAKGEEKRRFRSTTDPLTGLYNRSHALELAALEIKKAGRSNTPLSIILLDLDHFKEINLNYGRKKGDEVLAETARILKKHCRETDTLCRFGGEEFLLVLPDTDLHGAVANARKNCKSFEEKRYPHSKGDFNVTASFGVAQWSPDEADISEALKRADAALHSVKNCGRNNVRWMPSRINANGINDIVCWLNIGNE